MAANKSSPGQTVKPAPRKSWTKTRVDRFMAALRQTANVSAASRAADMSPQAAYRRRAEQPAFSAAWNEALCEGYGRLEQLLLAQAIAGLNTDDDAPPAAVPRMKISERTIVSLLSLHRQTVRELRENRRGREGATADDTEDARAELEATLGMMRERLAAEDEG